MNLKIRFIHTAADKFVVLFIRRASFNGVLSRFRQYSIQHVDVIP